MLKPKNIVLFLNENPLPLHFTRGTISGKELRLRAAIDQIDEVHVVARRGAWVTSHQTAETKLEEKIVIHLLPPWPYYLSTLGLFFAGFYYAWKLKPITVEAESPHLSGPAAILIGKILSIPSIIEVRATYHQLLHYRFSVIPVPLKRFLTHLILTWSFRHATTIIANSSTYQTNLKSLGFSSTVINPGLQYAPKSSPAIHPFHQPIVVGYLGRLVPEKGVNLLLEAVSLLSHQGLVPAFRLEIAGAGPERPKLEALTQKLGLHHLVTFLGQVENYTVLTEWDILVNPCLVNHPLEMVNAEAAYLGVPVICFGNVRLPETVINLQTGLKLTHKTAHDLVDGLRYLLTHESVWKKMQLQGPEFAINQYAFDTQVKRLRHLYQDLKLLT
jgi:glycosyltransferase involved in cell wall biosynthesis